MTVIRCSCVNTVFVLPLELSMLEKLLRIATSGPRRSVLEHSREPAVDCAMTVSAFGYHCKAAYPSVQDINYQKIPWQERAGQ